MEKPRLGNSRPRAELPALHESLATPPRRRASMGLPSVAFLTPRIATSRGRHHLRAMSCLRILPVLWGLACLPACDNRPVVNRGGDMCSEELVSLKVEVITANGVLVKGATVTAVNEETQQSITGVTNEVGVSRAVNESLAPGRTRLYATAGSKVSPATEVEWQCDECHCQPIPSSVTLQLNP